MADCTLQPSRTNTPALRVADLARRLRLFAEASRTAAAYEQKRPGGNPEYFRGKQVAFETAAATVEELLNA